MHPLDFFKKKWKTASVSIRFSILAVFISLFTISTLVVIGTNYYRLTNNMRNASLTLMGEISNYVYSDIVKREMLSAELASSSIAALINQGILNANNMHEIQKYFYSLLKSESQTVIQLISYGDEKGNVYDIEKQDDGTILTQVVRTHDGKAVQTNTYRSKDDKITQIKHFPTQFDPRKRPWYINAVTKGKSTWTDIFTYQGASTGIRGTGVSTPIYTADHKLKGVLFVAIRFDDLADLLESINVSDHGFVFVVTENGMLLSISKVKNRPDVGHKLIYLQDIDMPMITHALHYYLKHHRSEFVLNENGIHYVVIFKQLPDNLPGKWLIGVMAPETDFTGDVRIRNILTFVFGFLVLILGILIVSKLINWIVKPIDHIVSETEQIKQFRLEGPPLKSSKITEINLISNAINSMKLGLRSFQKYIPASLVRQLIERGQDVKIGGSKMKLAIFFSDIKDFTSIAEITEANQLTTQLCEYFDKLSSVIDAHGGTIDKFIGDSIMAFWGAPVNELHSCQDAAITALICIKISNALNNYWKKENKPLFFTRIGMHYGDAIVGNMGSKEHLNYTAISDAINMASRLEGINKIYGSQIIISHAFYEELKKSGKFIIRLLDYILPKGKNTPNYIYELLGTKESDLSYDIHAYNTQFQMAFQAYQNQQWDSAVQGFKKCLMIYPEDNIALIFIQRSEKFKINPPKQPWDGAWVVSEK